MKINTFVIKVIFSDRQELHLKPFPGLNFKIGYIYHPESKEKAFKSIVNSYILILRMLNDMSPRKIAKCYGKTIEDRFLCGFIDHYHDDLMKSHSNDLKIVESFNAVK